MKTQSNKLSTQENDKLRGYNIFFNISLIIVILYCVLNANTIIGWSLDLTGVSFTVWSAIVSTVLTIDLVTWSVFTAFVFVSLVIKIVVFGKNKIFFKPEHIIKTVLHIAFSAIALFEIRYVLIHSF